jgi:DNA-directed RNA polymerase subunit RPC12/RpoP
MDPVDGNAFSGLLTDAFGKEITSAWSTCAGCGNSALVAELVVYQQASGTVVRCRACGSVIIVLVKHEDGIDIDVTGLASLSQPGQADGGREG